MPNKIKISKVVPWTLSKFYSYDDITGFLISIFAIGFGRLVVKNPQWPHPLQILLGLDSSRDAYFFCVQDIFKPKLATYEILLSKYFFPPDPMSTS